MSERNILGIPLSQWKKKRLGPPTDMPITAKDEKRWQRENGETNGSSATNNDIDSE